MKRFIPEELLLIVVVVPVLIIVVMVIYSVMTADNTDYRDKENTSLKHQLQESQHFLELSEGRYQVLCDRAPVECGLVE